MLILNVLIIVSAIAVIQTKSCDEDICNSNGTKSCKEGICTCKSNVIGADCSACRYGTIDLDARNERGCAKCHCMDHSPSCKVKTWAISYVGEAFEATRAEGWTVQGLKNDRASGDLIRSFRDSPEYVAFTKFYEQLGTSNFYWVLPKQHTGDWLRSYGGSMFYTLNLRCGTDFSCSFNQDPWVILEGGLLQDIQTIYHYIFQGKGEKWRGLKEVTIPIHEGYTKRTCWRTPDLKCISRKTMIEVLSNVVSVRIKAGIFRSSYDMAIGGYRREIASHDGDVARRVEVCNCPAPYTGTSCHLCSAGMWHKHGWGCDKCNCNGYTHTCDSFTGQCTNCAYDTACHNCDCCAAGFYGQPLGEPNPCKPCPCNGLAATCTTTEDGSFGQCVNCEEGYEGRFCEMCSDGYFGNPGHGIPCTKCYCSGNIDISNTGNCHNVTGECNNCLNHSAGPQCGVCERGYYGDARKQQCRPCRCNMIGAKDNVCDATSGQCQCKTNVVGALCDQCAEETFGISHGKGCTECDCDTTGTLFGSNECHVKTGQCPCRLDRQYRKCDGCVDGYFLVLNGCKSCGCPSERSLNYSCNGITGDCFCAPQYTGQKCEVAACKRGPWSDWTPCTKPCGKGTQTRTRRVLLPDTDLGLETEQCGSQETETRSCNTASCVLDNQTECQVVEVLQPRSYQNCRTRRHHVVRRCQGACSHGDIVCCQPYLLTQKKYRLHCMDGSKIYHTFDEVQQCGCLNC